MGFDIFGKGFYFFFVGHIGFPARAFYLANESFYLVTVAGSYTEINRNFTLFQQYIAVIKVDRKRISASTEPADEYLIRIGGIGKMCVYPSDVISVMIADQIIAANPFSVVGGEIVFAETRIAVSETTDVITTADLDMDVIRSGE